jgi:hypothetical protein
MAQPLTNIQEPGFFSQIQVSPSLFLTPGSVQVVGLIGEGKATKTVSQNVTRGAGLSDALSGPISSISLTASTSVYRFPQSSYSAALLGSVDLTTITYPAGPNAAVLNVQVDGQAIETVTFASPANAAALVAQINAAMTNVQAAIDTGNKLLLYVDNIALAGKSFVVLAGTADALLGITAGARASSLRWDPAVIDPEFAPQAGQDYQVTLETPKVATDFAPQSYFSLSQVVAAQGDASASNTLSLGAQAAFGNGASIVTCRQLDPVQVALGNTQKAGEIIAALSDLENQTISVLVPMIPLNDASNVVTQYLDHVSKMSSKLERMERICILGMDETAGRLGILGVSNTWQSFMTQLQPALSSGLEPKRVVVVNPGQATTQYKGSSITTNGTYAAACLAGEMVSSEFDEATPMTRKALATITELILPDLMRSEKNQLTALGVTVVEANNGLVVVRRAVTADGSSIANQEPSIVRAFDRVASELRAGLENRFIGQKILGTTHTAIEAATTTFLERLVVSEIIGSYRNIKAVQNAVEPRQFDVSFEAVPIFPFIWGFIDISITLS